MAIPLPDVTQFGDLRPGLETGSGLFQRMMAPVMQQRGLDQAQQHHLATLAMQQAQQQRLAQQHQENLMFKQSAEDRKVKEFEAKQALNPYEMDLLKQKILTEGVKQKRQGPATREQKLQDQKDLAQYKASLKTPEDYTKPTKAVITANQNIVNAVNNVVPQIQALKKLKTPNLLTGKYTDADTTAKYDKATDAVADSLMASFKWLGIEASLEMAKGMTKRQMRESDEGYHKRLDELAEELMFRQKNANRVLTDQKVQPNLATHSADGVTGEETSAPKRKRFNQETGKLE
jgi:hypothetical protein